MPYTQEQLRERYLKLPKDTQDAIFSVEAADVIQDIGKKYNLHIDKVGFLADETGLVLLGITHPRDFVSSLAQKLGVEHETARRIAEDVNQQIFQKIRESLRKIHGITEREGVRPPEVTIIKEEKVEERKPVVPVVPFEAQKPKPPPPPPLPAEALAKAGPLRPPTPAEKIVPPVPRTEEPHPLEIRPVREKMPFQEQESVPPRPKPDLGQKEKPSPPLTPTPLPKPPTPPPGLAIKKEEKEEEEKIFRGMPKEEEVIEQTKPPLAPPPKPAAPPPKPPPAPPPKKYDPYREPIE